MDWAPFSQLFEKFVNIPHSILTLLVMCRLRAADSTKKMPGGAPKTEGAEHLCLSHKHRPQGWILQLIQKFLHVAAQFMNYQAGEWDDGCHKQWEHRKAVWHGKNSLESMVAPCTGGCRVEGSLRHGAQTPAHSGTNPTFNPTAQGHLQSSLQILQRSWFTLCTLTMKNIFL